MTKDNR